MHVIAIAYDTPEEFDYIKKYYTNFRHFEHLQMVLFEDKDSKEVRKLLPEHRVASNPTGYTYRLDVGSSPSHNGNGNLDLVYDQGIRPEMLYTVEQLGYRDIHRLLRYDYAIDEITRQANSPVPPCGDSNVVVVLDTGINDSHEVFSRGFRVHLSDMHVLDAKGLVLRRSAIGDDGKDDFQVHGHGTAVSSLIRLFAPNADIISMKVIRKVGNEWQATDEEILTGMNDALHIIDVERQRKHSFGVPYLAEIFNMSFGGAPTATPAPVELAIENVSKRRRQAIFIGAAGNTGPSQGTIVTPAQSPWCVAVGACDSSFLPTYFSARGPTRGLTKPEYLMFGSGITSASRQGSSAYATFTGTSFAAPLLSGGIATMLSGALFITPQVQNFLRQFTDLRLDIQGILNLVGTRITVKPQVAGANLYGKDNTYGWGIPQGDRVASVMGFLVQERPIPTTTTFDAITNMLISVIAIGGMTEMLEGVVVE